MISGTKRDSKGEKKEVDTRKMEKIKIVGDRRRADGGIRGEGTVSTHPACVCLLMRYRLHIRCTGRGEVGVKGGIVAVTTKCQNFSFFQKRF